MQSSGHPKHKYNWEDSGAFGVSSDIKMPLHCLDGMKLYGKLYMLSSSYFISVYLLFEKRKQEW